MTSPSYDFTVLHADTPASANPLYTEIDRLKRERDALADALTEIYPYAQLYHSQCVLDEAMNSRKVLGKEVAETRMEKARAALAQVRK